MAKKQRNSASFAKGASRFSFNRYDPKRRGKGGGKSGSMRKPMARS